MEFKVGDYVYYTAIEGRSHVLKIISINGDIVEFEVIRPSHNSYLFKGQTIVRSNYKCQLNDCVRKLKPDELIYEI